MSIFENERFPNIELNVFQKPVEVQFECPHCNEETTIAYSEFKDVHGEPPDWMGLIIKCPHCGKAMCIDSQNWS